MSHEELRHMLELFGREQACYTSLLDLSRRQHALIEQGDMDELLRVLGRKQSILQNVQTIEDDLAPFKLNWRTIRERFDDDDRHILDVALSTVEELLGELIATERASEDLLVHYRNETQAQLTQVIKSEAVQSAYAPPTTGESRYLDVRSE